MNNRPMRRARQELSLARTTEVLATATSGTLALQGDDGYPYAVPLSFAFEMDASAPAPEPVPAPEPTSDGARPRMTLWFHCAAAGYKLDAIAACDKASFCVIGTDDVVPQKFTTMFRSAIATGRVRIVADDAERMHALRLIAGKYSPDLEEGFRHEIETSFKRTVVLAMDVQTLSGKEGIEFIRQRAK